MQRNFSTMPRIVVTGAFILGILSAFSFRVLIVFKYIEPSLVRPVWYTGIVGYIFFFFYRFRITSRRKDVIRDYKLIEALEENKPLSETEREALLYVTSSVVKSLEHYNYYAIFIFSIAAILADILLMLLYS